MRPAVCSTTWATATDGRSARSLAPGQRRPADSRPVATTVTAAHWRAATQRVSSHRRTAAAAAAAPLGVVVGLSEWWVHRDGARQLPEHRQSIANEQAHWRPPTTRIVGKVALAWSLRSHRRVSLATRSPSDRQLAHIRHRRYRSG